MGSSAKAAVLALAVFLGCSLQGAAADKCLFMGHSFFAPMARNMPNVTSVAGIAHEQAVIFSGGNTGTPSSLWNNDALRTEAQGYLDAGDIEVLGMTLDMSDWFGVRSLEAYEQWFDYALSKNPNTKFMIGFPWIIFPSNFDSQRFATIMRIGGISAWKVLFRQLQQKYPGVTIIDVPYQLGVVELRLLFDEGLLPDVAQMTGPSDSSIFRDQMGHGGHIVDDLASLIWLNRIYGVDLLTYGGQLDYATDLRMVAMSILDAYDAGRVCGLAPCSTQ